MNTTEFIERIQQLQVGVQEVQQNANPYDLFADAENDEDGEVGFNVYNRLRDAEAALEAVLRAIMEYKGEVR